jgi:hypothetical protein
MRSDELSLEIKEIFVGKDLPQPAVGHSDSFTSKGIHSHQLCHILDLPDGLETFLSRGRLT